MTDNGNIIEPSHRDSQAPTLMPETDSLSPKRRSFVLAAAAMVAKDTLMLSRKAFWLARKTTFITLAVSVGLTVGLVAKIEQTARQAAISVSPKGLTQAEFQKQQVAAAASAARKMTRRLEQITDCENDTCAEYKIALGNWVAATTAQVTRSALGVPPETAAPVPVKNVAKQTHRKNRLKQHTR